MQKKFDSKEELAEHVRNVSGKLLPKDVQDKMIEFQWSNRVTRSCGRTPEQEKKLNHKIENPNLYKLTRTNQKNITKDWAKEFPEMAIDKKISHMTIMKRIGPLLVGVYLKKRFMGGEDEYKPILTLHSFLIPSEQTGGHIWYASNHRPKDLEDRLAMRVLVYEHKDKYHRAVKVTKELSLVSGLIPIEGQINFSQVVSVFENASRFDNACLFSSWCGEKHLAGKYYDLFIDKLESSKLEEPNSSVDWVPREQLKYLADCVKNPELVRETVNKEIARHELEYVPFSNIIDSPYQV